MKRKAKIFVVSLLMSIKNLEGFSPLLNCRRLSKSLRLSQENSCPGSKSRDLLTQHEIVWKIRPSEDTPKPEALKLLAQAKLLRLEYKRQNVEPPLILCPQGSPLILLEAHHDNTRIGRFGITIQRGPMAPPIAETVENLFGLNATGGLGIGAIKYMFVEPNYRKRNVGQLAIEVIALIHAHCCMDFTILVADDTSGDDRTLVKWYEANGYTRAPRLQNLLGSPNGQFGVAMIAPTRGDVPEGLRIEWW